MHDFSWLVERLNELVTILGHMLSKPRPRPTVHQIAKDSFVKTINFPGSPQGKAISAYVDAQALYDHGTKWEEEQGDE